MLVNEVTVSVSSERYKMYAEFGERISATVRVDRTKHDKFANYICA